MVGVLLATLALTGCGARSSMLSPHGVGAQEITNLWWIIFGIAAGVFVVVEGFLLFALIRFRHRPDRPLPRQVSGNTKLEIGWTAVPAVILLAVLVVTFSTMKAVAASAPGALQVNVIGHQWWWEFQYRVNGQLVTTADELHLPVNQSVTLHVMSADVVHDFWVPELDRKVQAIPGHDNVIPIEATKVGTYQGYCAEFCGLEHALMRFTAVVQSQPEFSAWLKGQEAGPVSPTTPQEKAGQAAFKADGCSICHEIGNAPVAGFPYNGLVITGPNLTHVGSRSTIVADQLQNTPANLERWLSAPDKIKPGNYMSVFIHDGQLSPKDVQDITAYLESLK
ncbi:MAG: cytochrome c oxidase subunit II [Chloroflexi bacterium]|nr:cytochrome c oxidase subunit II [Chloroflexota bacterium]